MSGTTLAFVCDFDGTVAPDDIGAAFVRRFGRGPADDLERALDRWRGGEIGHRELTEVECRRLAVTEVEARAFARGFGVDPEFAGFVAEVRRAGHVVWVASEGFDFYIADLLQRVGLQRVPYFANRLRFEAGRATPEFPHPDGCGRCGNCKGARVRDAQRLGFTVVLIGDGLSDRCGARAADRVLARDSLLDWCRAEGIPAEPFEGFAGLSRRTRGLDADRKGPRPEGA